MKEYKVPVYRVVDQIDVYRIDRPDGMTVLAAEEGYTGQVGYDGCGYAWASTSQPGWVKDVHICCEFCTDVAEAWEFVTGLVASGVAAPEIEKRMGARGYSACWVVDYGADRLQVVPFGNKARWRGRRYLMVSSVGGAENFARMWVATTMNQTWVVGYAPTAEVPEDAVPQDLPETFGGVVWNNVDVWGASSPAESELFAIV